MSQEQVQETHTPSKQSRLRWRNAIKTFFDLPNPKIFKLLVGSSTATFSLGIAFMIEWTLHGQHHLGFHWIIFYALFLVFLPIIIWAILLFSAYYLHRSTQVGSTVDEETRPAHDPLAVIKSSNVSGFVGTKEDENSNCRSLVVATTDERNKSNAQKTPTLERTVSLPLPIPTTDQSMISKRTSLRLF